MSEAWQWEQTGALNRLVRSLFNSREVLVPTLERVTTQGGWGYVKERRFSLYGKIQDSSQSLVGKRNPWDNGKDSGFSGKRVLDWTDPTRINKSTNNKCMYMCISVHDVNIHSFCSFYQILCQCSIMSHIEFVSSFCWYASNLYSEILFYTAAHLFV